MTRYEKGSMPCMDWRWFRYSGVGNETVEYQNNSLLESRIHDRQKSASIGVPECLLNEM